VLARVKALAAFDPASRGCGLDSGSTQGSRAFNAGGDSQRDRRVLSYRRHPAQRHLHNLRNSRRGRHL